MTAQALTRTNNGCQSSHPGTAMPDQWPQALVTAPQLARICQVSTRTISGWIAAKKVPVIKIGASVRFNVPEVMAALSRFTIEPVTIR